MSNVNINIPDTVIEEIASEVVHHFDYADIAQDVAKHIDADEIISSASRSIMEDLVNDSIDYERVYDNIRDDVYNQIDNSMSDNVNDAIWSLLHDYSPTNACGTGRLFMAAIEKTIIHLLEQPTNVTWLQDKLCIEEAKNTKEVNSEPDQFVPLFNPDLIAIHEVVRNISDKYLVDHQINNPGFLIDLQMEMWNHFVNSRSSYVESLDKEKS
jgi:hypothetical protein